MIRITKYTPDNVIEAAARVETYINSTFQVSKELTSSLEFGIMTYFKGTPHRGRNAPKRETSSQRRAAKRLKELQRERLHLRSWWIWNGDKL